MLNTFDIAKAHSLVCDKPAPNFFEGALLGNGGLGVVVTTRPDAICLHLGHNNVWDIRVQEKNQDKIGDFDYVFNKVKEIPGNTDSLTKASKWYEEYTTMARENYACKYPRPFPCGTIILFYDRREAEVLGHVLDISCGLCTINMSYKGEKYNVKIIVDSKKDQIDLKVFNEQEQAIEGIFNRVLVIPETDEETQLPKYEIVNNNENQLSYRQLLPYKIPEERNDNEIYIKDKSFMVTLECNQVLDQSTNIEERHKVDVCGLQTKCFQEEELGSCLDPNASLDVNIRLYEGLAKEIFTKPIIEKKNDFEIIYKRTLKDWEKYWQECGIQLEDKYLEKIWYHNNYFTNCVINSGINFPGLFGNWMYHNIGTEWHGDYHFNYNTQQVTWGLFSSNHLDKHLSYVSLIEKILPVSKKWAKEYYGLEGAYFPHSAYPTEMNYMPYPIPHWGWEVCETPWAIQSLWWHYTYSKDKLLLKNRLFKPIKEAVRFLTSYMMREEGGEKNPNNGKYHVFPTVVPELYGLTPGFIMNADCIVDLALIKFVFKAYITACEELDIQETEQELINKCRTILEHYPEYEIADTEYGKTFINVKGENPEIIHNTPNTCVPVFPGEDIDMDTKGDMYDIAKTTWERHRNEGGNDLVFYNLQGSRLGLLDIEKFKRQIKYCSISNGTCTDRVLMTGGRYGWQADFDFMRNMGIWVENFGLTAVINDCLIHGHKDVIRLFPNWDKTNEASFHQIRTVGAFLVSAHCKDGEVTEVIVTSENGGIFKLYDPWKEEQILEYIMKPQEQMKIKKDN